MFVRLVRSVGALLHQYLNLRVLHLGILGVVLVALAILQYRWIDEASRAQEAGAKARLHEGVRLISDALDAEIARAALVFTLLPARPPGYTTRWQKDGPSGTGMRPGRRLFSGCR